MPAAGCRTVSRRLITDHCVPQPCFAAAHAVRLVPQWQEAMRSKTLELILRGDLRRRREAYSRTITSSYPDSYHLLVSTTTPTGSLRAARSSQPNGCCSFGQLSASYLEGSWRACARTA